MESLIIFLPFIAVMYFMLLRPQQQKMKAQAALLAALDVGDDVLTESGVYGVVSSIDGDTVFLLVADGVEIKVTKRSIAALIDYDESEGHE